MDRKGGQYAPKQSTAETVSCKHPSEYFFTGKNLRGGQHAPKQFAGRREIRSPPLSPFPL